MFGFKLLWLKWCGLEDKVAPVPSLHMHLSVLCCLGAPSFTSHLFQVSLHPALPVCRCSKWEKTNAAGKESIHPGTCKTWRGSGCEWNTAVGSNRAGFKPRGVPYKWPTKTRSSFTETPSGEFSAGELACLGNKIPGIPLPPGVTSTVPSWRSSIGKVGTGMRVTVKELCWQHFS